ncbi:uncharacterized protein MELLADRAFT_72404 [Melampsora larici-populina 98AG31]|uniref:Cyclin N-terminal domain-containing protein n=1 Tax=Melampsora larici-populina (strain 98AG31 / pathotype 3-4-7) TaxID=747676 RepID=F4RT93_MELLP|nr:uncharacterized protein MELLADRAFT_72404 [Melampsora larici-populina 98AG31]EGG04473.1 hypothetical protein MELLADRAFT_72404 [Melampsora larici-populina 98AG31]
MSSSTSTSTASATNSTTTTAPTTSSGTDQYYGYGRLAQFSAKVITFLFPRVTKPTTEGEGSEEANNNAKVDQPDTKSGEAEEKIPCLVEFIAYALFRTRLSEEAIYGALILLTRLKSFYPGAKGTATSPHRLFITSLMLSSKMSMDDTYSNKSWAIVAQNLFGLEELNRMERELFGFLKMKCLVTPEELNDWCDAWSIDSPSGHQYDDEERREKKKQKSSSEAEDSASSHSVSSHSAPSIGAPATPSSFDEDEQNNSGWSSDDPHADSSSVYPPSSSPAPSNASSSDQ